ncbi:calpain family cysteine protease [Nocardioides albertanoniae]|uniref:Calpain family cysteine protease n=1 Tax=Nocardioides albertanoniae TaxID=1175486 RepID=A0A543A7J9_9ACTN|nr:C2 family cysteine protease [Nocardioides albertanoniae]TQL68575.1 calpain family cysteine protease [Nocardioides albertanoniae]
MSLGDSIEAIGNAGLSPQGRPIRSMNGNPETVESNGDEMVQAGQDMVKAATTLLQIQANQLGGGEMAGHAVDALRESVGSAAYTLTQAGELYEPVGTALKRYGSSVSGTKTRADTLASSCEDLWQTYLSLPGDKDGASSPDDVSVGPVPLPADSPVAKEIAEDNQAKADAYEAWKQEATQWDAAYDEWKDAYDAALAEVHDGTVDAIEDYVWENFDDDLTEDRSSDPLYPDGEPEMDDIHQGAFGDCWLLSTLAGQAQADPSKIEDMITDNGDGTYTVRFADGEEVTVDDNALLDHGDVDQAKWISVIESAYAAREGSYGDIDGGNAENAMEDLFGYDVDNFDPDSTKDFFFGNNVSPEDSYNRIDDALDDNRPVSASVRDELGIEGGHSLTVTDVYEVDGVKYVELRNPWASHGQMEDPINEAGGTTMGDGIFRMPLDEFADNFAEVQVAK